VTNEGKILIIREKFANWFTESVFADKEKIIKIPIDPINFPTNAKKILFFISLLFKIIIKEYIKKLLEKV